MDSCGPCQTLKDDMNKAKQILDLDFEYVDLDDSNISEDHKKSFSDLIDKHGNGVPLMLLESKCGSTSHQGYAGVDTLFDLLLEIRCDKDEVVS